MLAWLKKRRQAEAALRAAEHQAFLDALQAVVGIANAHARANEALSEAIRTWLELFKVEGKPTTWVNDDLSESLQAAERLQRLQEEGFPTHMSPAEQAAWVAALADRTF